jgi:hypothetical protein
MPMPAVPELPAPLVMLLVAPVPAAATSLLPACPFPQVAVAHCGLPLDPCPQLATAIHIHADASHDRQGVARPVVTFASYQTPARDATTADRSRALRLLGQLD